MIGEAGTAKMVSLTVSSDVHKFFVDDESYHAAHGHAYGFYRMDPEKGAVAIVRPYNCRCPLECF